MLQIMKKDVLFHLVVLFQFLPLMYLGLNFHNLKHDDFISSFLFIGPYIILVIISEAMYTEQIEMKNNGYNFLKTLPLQNLQIVHAKFANILIAAFLIYMQGILAVALIVKVPDLLFFCKIILFVYTIIALWQAAILYVLCFYFSWKIVYLILWIFFVIAQISSMIFFEKYSIQQIITFFSGFNMVGWFAILFGSLVVFFIIMQLAIHLFDRRFKYI